MQYGYTLMSEEPVIYVHQLQKRYDKVEAVKGIDGLQHLRAIGDTDVC